MNHSHRCSLEQLLRVAFGDPAVDERSASRDHLSRCITCRAEMDVLQRIAAGADWNDPTRLAPPASRWRIEEIRQLPEVAQRAEELAHERVALILAQPSETWWCAVAADDSLFCPAIVKAILAAADRLMNSTPRESLRVYSLATFAADAAAARGGGLELAVEAWKNYAYILCRVGEYALAEEALDEAEQRALDSGYRELALASINLVRAIVLRCMQRFTEALTETRAARDRFRQLGDHERFTKAREEEANILWSIGDGDGAVAILLGLIDEDADDETRARRYANIAMAFEMAGALWSASEYLARANAIHQRLGATFFLHRNMWALGRILNKLHRVDEAIDALAAASEGFRRLDATDNLIRVDLDRSEIEIENGIETDETYQRLRLAASVAIEKHLPVAKWKALDYLQRLGRAATTIHVRSVRDYLAHFDNDPTHDFVPPYEQIS